MSEIDVNVISLFVTSPPTAFLTGREDIAFPGRDVGGHWETEECHEGQVRQHPAAHHTGGLYNVPGRDGLQSGMQAKHT